ncbi:MAG: zeta toxin family protein [Desulfobulbaceae bacterium]|nr:zeta toxin family protein [Desulfobulbaceae bacterium]
MGRVRIFAGPNGSGKTTVNEELKGQFNLGYYLNADDLCLKVEKDDRIDLSCFNLSPSFAELESFFCDHNLYQTLPFGISFKLVDSCLVFSKQTNMYEIAILADYLRHSLLKTKATFSFETVFSHPDKVSFIEKANKQGYRTYLYFVSTNSPEINIARVKARVSLGGHDVPESKILKRYKRSLDNLLPAMKLAYRTYMFDNSGKQAKLIAQVTPAKNMHVEAKQLPIWFEEYVLSRLSDQTNS